MSESQKHAELNKLYTILRISTINEVQEQAKLALTDCKKKKGWGHRLTGNGDEGTFWGQGQHSLP